MKNEKFLITFEEFENHIKSIERLINFENGLRCLIHSYKKNNEEIIELSFPTLITNTIQLLAILTQDVNDWIGYWVFDLECGTKYKDGCVKDVNNNDIPLKTIKDLWDILNMEE